MFTKIEILKNALFHNIQAYRNILSSSIKFCAVVKSNAYGHGLELITKLAIEGGVDLLGVNSIEEAMLVRKIDPTVRILIMGEISDIENNLYLLNDSNLDIVVSRIHSIKVLNQLSNHPKIHLKTDTGMGRLGYGEEDFYQNMDKIAKAGLRIDGIMMHFASTEDFTEHSYSQKQLIQFREYVQYAEKLGYTKLIRHASASASTLLFAEAHFDLVRIGISLYGLWPSLETQLSLSLIGNQKFTLQPVLTWKTKIVHLKEAKAGTFIGYGSTYKTNHPSKIAVIPVGYYEGYNRRLSNLGYVLVRGERSPIIGRVCMNMSMIDVTHIESIQIGDEVILIGKSGNETVSADYLASLTNTINYDIVTSINPNLPRFVLEIE